MDLLANSKQRPRFVALVGPRLAGKVYSVSSSQLLAADCIIMLAWWPRTVVPRALCQVKCSVTCVFLHTWQFGMPFLFVCWLSGRVLLYLAFRSDYTTKSALRDCTAEVINVGDWGCAGWLADLNIYF